MSRTTQYSGSQSDSPFDARDKAKVRTDWKTLFIMVGGAFTAGVLWMAVKSEMQAISLQNVTLSANQVEISKQLAHEHDTIRDVQSYVHELDRKVDYLVDGRRGPAPVSTPR